MNLVNQKVNHRTYGVGIIIEQGDTYVIVEFQTKSSKFIYPDAFTNFIKAEDESTQAAILKDIEDIKLAKEEKKRIESSNRAPSDEQKAIPKTDKHADKRYTLHKLAKASSRESNKPMVFFVFQGNTFDKEHQGGYIWAPITNKAGSNIHHWNKLLEIRTGDIILHGCDGYIAAISIARGQCYDYPQPEELRTEDLWDRDGRRVDCDYILMKHPIKTSSFKEDIIRLSTTKYSPFDRDGNGNMGYLFELNRELAKIFISALAKQNQDLKSIDNIHEFLPE